MTVWGWLVLVCWLVFLCYWAISAIGANKSVPRSWWREVGFRLAIVVTIFFLLRVPGFGRFLRSVGRRGALPGVPVAILGVALCAIGIGRARLRGRVFLLQRQDGREDDAEAVSG